MSDCYHPRYQGWTDERNRSRCGACGDVWVDGVEAGGSLPYGQFRPLGDDDEPIMPPRSLDDQERQEELPDCDRCGRIDGRCDACCAALGVGQQEGAPGQEDPSDA